MKATLTQTQLDFYREVIEWARIDGYTVTDKTPYIFRSDGEHVVIVPKPDSGFAGTPLVHLSYRGQDSRIPLVYFVAYEKFGDAAFVTSSTISFADGNSRHCWADNLMLKMAEVNHNEEGDSDMQISLDQERIDVLDLVFRRGFRVDGVNGILYGPDEKRRSVSPSGPGQPYRYTFHTSGAKPVSIHVASLVAFDLWGPEVVTPGVRILFADGNKQNHRGENLRLYDKAGREIPNPLLAKPSVTLDENPVIEESAKPELVLSGTVTATRPEIEHGYTNGKVNGKTHDPSIFPVETSPSKPAETASSNSAGSRPLINAVAAALGVEPAALDGLSEATLTEVIRTALMGSAEAREIVKAGLSREYVVTVLATFTRVVRSVSPEQARGVAQPLFAPSIPGWELADQEFDAHVK